MNFKDISIKELKEEYLERHGFVFAGNAACNRNNCDNVAFIVKSKGFTDYLPEFVVELNSQTFVFVYPVEANFESGAFFQSVKHAEMAFGAFKIDILKGFLNDQA
jgi:hypothetical protein